MLIILLVTFACEIVKFSIIQLLARFDVGHVHSETLHAEPVQAMYASHSIKLEGDTTVSISARCQPLPPSPLFDIHIWRTLRHDSGWLDFGNMILGHSDIKVTRSRCRGISFLLGIINCALMR